MAKVVCEDCGEVVERDVSKQEAQEIEHEHGQEIRDETGNDMERQEPEELEEELEEEYEEKVEDMEDEEKREQVEQDVQAYDGIEDVAEPEILVAKTGQIDVGRYAKAKQSSKQLARIFKDAFRKKEKTAERREQTSGRFDSRRMIQAERGSSRVFKKEDKPELPEYEAFIVLDRSGSMDGFEITRAEEATMSLMLALEEVGINTELMDFFNRTPRVIKTLHQTPEEQASLIVQGSPSADGGTPLAQVTKQMLERINQQPSDKEKFLIVVTDAAIQGKQREKFEEKIRDMEAQAIGLKIADNPETGLEASTQERMYHAYEEVGPSSDDMDQKLFSLARKVML